MTIWEDRPTEAANLFNPAFCGEIMRLCIKSYVDETAGRSFPYALSFLILPTLMYKDTRTTMTVGRYKYLYNWLQEHPHLRVGFAYRIRELLPISKESLAFLLQLNALVLDDEAGFSPTRYSKRRLSSQYEDYTLDFYNNAKLLGKWLAKASDVVTIYTMWGIQP